MNKLKKTIVILISVFVVASCLFAVYATKKSSRSDYASSSELDLVTEYEDNLEINKYINSDGEVTFAGDKEYAIVTRLRDEENRITLERYFNENNEPVMRSGGYSAVSYSYSDSKRVQTYLDSNLNPVNASSGYSVVERCLLSSDSKDYIEMYYDSNMSHVTNYAGAYGIKYLYEGDLSTEYYWLDQNQNPMNSIMGYSRVVRTFDSNNRVRSEMYFDFNSNPVKDKNGEYGIYITYNEDGRRDKVVSLDSNGNPMINSLGYVSVVYAYDSYGNVETERYYGIDNAPAATAKGWYGVRHDGSRIYYLDINGKDIISIDSLLNNFPLMVSVFGVIVCLVFIFAPRKINIGVTIFYFVFILYETILYRLRHQPTMNLELFWSYKQFFTDESLRIEILNNIWLFVPYSLGLLAVLKKKKNVIIFLFLPVLIEIAQYVFGIGLFELDDIISNGLGELIGIGIWYVFLKGKNSSGVELKES